MPNHVINKLFIDASPIKLAEIKNAIAGKEDNPYIDFNKVIPMPKCLEDSTSGGREHHARALILKLQADATLKELYDIDKDQFWKNVQKHVKIPDDAMYYATDFIDDMKKYLDIHEKTGYTSWHNWCVDKWGTKWGAYGQEDQGDTISFQTAWSSPAPVIQELSKKYPKIRFTVTYADEDLGSNCGMYVCKDGQIVEDVPRDFDFACEMWGYDPEEERAERDQDSDD